MRIDLKRGQSALLKLKRTLLSLFDETLFMTNLSEADLNVISIGRYKHYDSIYLIRYAKPLADFFFFRLQC